MTTDNIKNLQVLVEADDGQVLVGTTNDPIVIRMIAAYVKFVKVDKNKFTSIPIKEIMK